MIVPRKFRLSFFVFYVSSSLQRQLTRHRFFFSLSLSFKELTDKLKFLSHYFGYYSAIKKERSSKFIPNLLKLFLPFLVRLERNSISSNCVVTVWPDFKKRLFERVDSLLIILLVLSVQVCGRVAGVMCFKFVLNVCLGVCMRACDLIPLLQCVLFQS